MNLDKAKKRIAKHVKRGFKGYPLVSIDYYGNSKDCATEVVIQFKLSEDAEAQEERFSTQTDARESEVMQTTLLKIIERANAASVIESEVVIVS